MLETVLPTTRRGGISRNSRGGPDKTWLWTFAVSIPFSFARVFLKPADVASGFSWRERGGGREVALAVVGLVSRNIVETTRTMAVCSPHGEDQSVSSDGSPTSLTSLEYPGKRLPTGAAIASDGR